MWWHNIIKNKQDKPDIPGFYLLCYKDNSYGICYYSADTGIFLTDKGRGNIVSWTDQFMMPDELCRTCDKASWDELFSEMVYICDRGTCSQKEEKEKLEV